MRLSLRKGSILSIILIVCLCAPNVLGSNEAAVYTLQSILMNETGRALHTAVALNTVPAQITYDFPWYVYEQHGIINAEFTEKHIIVRSEKTNTIIDMNELLATYVRTIFKSADGKDEVNIRNGVFALSPVVTDNGSGLEYFVTISIITSDGTEEKRDCRFILPFDLVFNERSSRLETSEYSLARREYATVFSKLHPYIVDLRDLQTRLYNATERKKEIRSVLDELTVNGEKGLAGASLNIWNKSQEEIEPGLRLLPYLMFFTRRNSTYSFGRSTVGKLISIDDHSELQIVACIEEFRQTMVGVESYNIDVIIDRIEMDKEYYDNWFERGMNGIFESVRAASSKMAHIILRNEAEMRRSGEKEKKVPLLQHVPHEIIIDASHKARCFLALSINNVMSRETIVKRRKVIRLLCDIGIDMKPSDVNTLFQTDDKNNPVFNILHMRTDELTRFKNVINDMIHNEGIPLTQAIKKDMETGGLNVRYPVMKSHLDALKAKDNQKPEQPEARNDEPRVKTERTHQNGVKTIVRPLPGMIKQPSINQSKTGDRPHEKARSEAPAPVIKKPPAATARYPHGVDTQKPLLKRPDAEAEPSPEYRAEKDWKKLIMQFPFKNGARETVVFAIMQAEEEEWVRKREDKNQAIIEIKELLSRAEKALPGEGNILSGIWYELYFKCVSFYQNEGKTDLTIDDLDEINNELRFIFAYHKWFRQAAQHNIKKIVNGVAENRSPQILRYSLLELSAEKNLEPNPVFILSDEEVHAMAHNYETSGRMVVLGIWEELKRGVYYKHEIKDNVLDGKGSEYHKKFEPMYERLYAKAREKRDEEINAMDTFQKLLTVELGADEVERRDTGSVIREIFIVKAA